MIWFLRILYYPLCMSFWYFPFLSFFEGKTGVGVTFVSDKNRQRCVFSYVKPDVIEKSACACTRVQSNLL